MNNRDPFQPPYPKRCKTLWRRHPRGEDGICVRKTVLEQQRRHRARTAARRSNIPRELQRKKHVKTVRIRVQISQMKSRVKDLKEELNQKKEDLERETQRAKTFKKKYHKCVRQSSSRKSPRVTRRRHIRDDDDDDDEEEEEPTPEQAPEFDDADDNNYQMVNDSPPGSKEKTPESKEKTPTPKEKTPTPKEKTPTPKEKTPTPPPPPPVSKEKPPSPVSGPKEKTPPTPKQSPASVPPLMIAWSNIFKQKFDFLDADNEFTINVSGTEMACNIVVTEANTPPDRVAIVNITTEDNQKYLFSVKEFHASEKSSSLKVIQLLYKIYRELNDTYKDQFSMIIEKDTSNYMFFNKSHGLYKNYIEKLKHLYVVYWIGNDLKTYLEDMKFKYNNKTQQISLSLFNDPAESSQMLKNVRIAKEFANKSFYEILKNNFKIDQKFQNQIYELYEKLELFQNNATTNDKFNFIRSNRDKLKNVAKRLVDKIYKLFKEWEKLPANDKITIIKYDMKLFVMFVDIIGDIVLPETSSVFNHHTKNLVFHRTKRTQNFVEENAYKDSDKDENAYKYLDELADANDGNVEAAASEAPQPRTGQVAASAFSSQPRTRQNTVDYKGNVMVPSASQFQQEGSQQYDDDELYDSQEVYRSPDASPK